MSISWDYNGSRLATTCKDKQIRVLDARTGEVLQVSNYFACILHSCFSSGQEGKGHDGNKPSRVVFCGKMNKLFTSGFSRMSERQYGLWNPVCMCTCISSQPWIFCSTTVQDQLDKPLAMENIDSASGVLFPFWDEGTHMVYLVGKVGHCLVCCLTSIVIICIPTQGDTQIRYFEVTDESPYVFFLNMYQSNVPGRSVCSMAKRHMDFMKCEVMRFFKLQHTKGLVEPISMTVPRKVCGCYATYGYKNNFTCSSCSVGDVPRRHFSTVSLWGACPHC